MILKSAEDILKVCKEKNASISEVAIMWESINNDISEEDIKTKMKMAYEQMLTSVKNGLSDDNESEVKSKMFRDDAKRIMEYRKNNKPLSGDVVSKAVGYALSVMEVNCSMGRVVASPTAGSCGVLPAAIMSTVEVLGLDEEIAIKGLLNAGLVGAIIGRNASLSGAQGGCQAEIGSASAMAAAALVEMSGGTPEMSFHAGAIALKNILGLVCDPVAGLVEVPCAKRNAMGVSNGLVAADMALAGIESVIPFDEVVWAMNEIGKTMPTSLKETSMGGLAATPTGKKLMKDIYK